MSIYVVDPFTIMNRKIGVDLRSDTDSLSHHDEMMSGCLTMELYPSPPLSDSHLFKSSHLNFWKDFRPFPTP